MQVGGHCKAHIMVPPPPFISYALVLLQRAVSFAHSPELMRAMSSVRQWTVKLGDSKATPRWSCGEERRTRNKAAETPPPPQTEPPGSLEDRYPMFVRIEGKPIALPQTPKQSGSGNTYWTYGGLRWNSNDWHILPHVSHWRKVGP